MWGAIKSNDWALVKRDIEGVVNATKGRAIVKVIIETCLLTDEEKVKACTVSKIAGAHFVKTSTGFSTGGATVADVKLIAADGGRRAGRKGFRRHQGLQNGPCHGTGRRKQAGDKLGRGYCVCTGCPGGVRMHQLRRLHQDLPRWACDHRKTGVLTLRLYS